MADQDYLNSNRLLSPIDQDYVQLKPDLTGSFGILQPTQESQLTSPLDIDIDIAFKNPVAFAADVNSHMLRQEKSKELSQGRKSRQEWVEFYTGVG